MAADPEGAVAGLMDGADDAARERVRSRRIMDEVAEQPGFRIAHAQPGHAADPDPRARIFLDRQDPRLLLGTIHAGARFEQGARAAGRLVAQQATVAVPQPQRAVAAALDGTHRQRAALIHRHRHGAVAARVEVEQAHAADHPVGAIATALDPHDRGRHQPGSGAVGVLEAGIEGFESVAQGIVAAQAALGAQQEASIVAFGDAADHVAGERIARRIEVENGAERRSRRRRRDQAAHVAAGPQQVGTIHHQARQSGFREHAVDPGIDRDGNRVASGRIHVPEVAACHRQPERAVGRLRQRDHAAAAAVRRAGRMRPDHLGHFRIGGLAAQARCGADPERVRGVHQQSVRAFHRVALGARLVGGNAIHAVACGNPDLPLPVRHHRVDGAGDPGGVGAAGDRLEGKYLAIAVGALVHQTHSIWPRHPQADAGLVQQRVDLHRHGAPLPGRQRNRGDVASQRVDGEQPVAQRAGIQHAPGVFRQRLGKAGQRAVGADQGVEGDEGVAIEAVQRALRADPHEALPILQKRGYRALHETLAAVEGAEVVVAHHRKAQRRRERERQRQRCRGPAGETRDCVWPPLQHAVSTTRKSNFSVGCRCPCRQPIFLARRRRGDARRESAFGRLRWHTGAPFSRPLP